VAFSLNVANYGTASGISLAASGTPDLVVACFTKDTANDPTSVQYGGVAMTRLTETVNGAQGAEIWYLVAGIPSGTQSITYTMSGTHRCWGGAFDCAAGKAAAFDVEAGTSGTSTGPSQAVTPTAQPNVIIACCAHEGANAMTGKGTGQVGMETGAGDGFVDEGTWNSAATYEPTTSTGSDTQSFTNGASDTWSLRVAVFKEVALLTADSANVPITGTAATVGRKLTLTADTANVPITGTAATVGRKLTASAASGAVPITGSDATLTYVEGAATLAAESGSVPITGTAATVGRKLTATAESGSIPITGTAATVGRKLTATAASGNVPIGGTAASLVTVHKVTADAGAVPIAGTATSLLLRHLVAAAAGAVPITGTSATLTYVPLIGSVFTLVAAAGSVPIGGVAAETRISSPGIIGERQVPRPRQRAYRTRRWH
jgi:hypothetical protein